MIYTQENPELAIALLILIPVVGILIIVLIRRSKLAKWADRQNDEMQAWAAKKRVREWSVIICTVIICWYGLSTLDDPVELEPVNNSVSSEVRSAVLKLYSDLQQGDFRQSQFDRLPPLFRSVRWNDSLSTVSKLVESEAGHTPLDRYDLIHVTGIVSLAESPELSYSDYKDLERITGMPAILAKNEAADGITRLLRLTFYVSQSDASFIEREFDLVAEVEFYFEGASATGYHLSRVKIEHKNDWRTDG